MAAMWARNTNITQAVLEAYLAAQVGGRHRGNPGAGSFKPGGELLLGGCALWNKGCTQHIAVCLCCVSLPPPSRPATRAQATGEVLPASANASMVATEGQFVEATSALARGLDQIGLTMGAAGGRLRSWGGIRVQGREERRARGMGRLPARGARC